MKILFLLCILMQTPPNEPTMYIDGISVSDVDVGEGEMKVTLGTISGRISLDSLSGLTFITGDGVYDQNIVFTAKINDVNSALNHIHYYMMPNNPQDDTLNIEVDDQGNTGSGGPQKATGLVAIVVPKPPIVNAPVALNATEDIIRNITGISIAQSNPTQNTIKINLSADNGTVRLYRIVGLTFIEGSGNDKSMVFYGSLADINTALSIVYYKSDLNFNGVDYVHITASDYNDIFGTTAGKNVKMNLAAANDRPALVLPQKVQKN